MFVFKALLKNCANICPNILKEPQNVQKQRTAMTDLKYCTSKKPMPCISKKERLTKLILWDTALKKRILLCLFWVKQNVHKIIYLTHKNVKIVKNYVYYR